jgi:hypothetical protein
LLSHALTPQHELSCRKEWKTHTLSYGLASNLHCIVSILLALLFSLFPIAVCRALRLKLILKLQDLHVLMTAAKAGSMGKVAQRLIASSKFSSAIVLETAGWVVRLLDRSRQGVERPTHGRARLH